MSRYITAGNYHSNMGRVDSFKDKPSYKVYGKHYSDVYNNRGIGYELSTNEICNIRGKCGKYKYGYDENYDLQDLCMKNCDNKYTLCIPSRCCIE